MREEDKICLQIEDVLRAGNNEIRRTLNIEDNIIGLFFHELMKYTTSYYLLKSSKYQYDDPLVFPYLNTNFIKAPSSLTHDYQPLMVGSNYRSYLLEIIKKFNALKIGSPQISVFNTNLAIKDLLKTTYINKRVYPITKADLYFIEKKNSQIAVLKSALLEIFDFLQESKKDIFINNFLQFASNYLTEKEETNTRPGDVLLTGSLSILSNRIMAANFRHQGKKVIGSAHGGNSNTRFDEPYVGYGELSFCDYYMDFGMTKDYQDLRYGKPLGEMPKLFHITSSKFKKIFKNKEVPFREINKKTKIAYLPTAFSKNLRYGPFRDMDDLLYLKWQKELFKLDLDITYKVHPNHLGVDLSFAEKKDYRNLFSCYKDYDFFIVDYFGTGHAIAAATNKPVIYFDLGLRNMTENFVSSFKERAFWCDIDFGEELFPQITNAIGLYNNYGKSFVNNFTMQDSLMSDSNITKVINQCN